MTDTVIHALVLLGVAALLILAGYGGHRAERRTARLNAERARNRTP